MIIKRILENKEVLPYLEARNLLKQYQKAKQYLLQGQLSQASFKLRQPKKDDIWYFRINKQFRAIGYFAEDGDFIVVTIDNHQ